MQDEKDLEIISHLQEDGRRSLSVIEKKIGLSSVAIWKRLKKLLAKKVIKISANINVTKLFPKVGIINAEIENYNIMESLISKYENCPRKLLMFTYGGSNLITVLVGEDSSTLDCVIGNCSVRVQEGVRRSDVTIGEFPTHPDFFLPIIFPKEVSDEVGPCEIRCEICQSYKDKKCLGCPATIFYKKNPKFKRP